MARNAGLPVNVSAVARFEGTGRQAVHELKYTRHWNIATLLGPLMAAKVGRRDAVIVPVPLHWRRRSARGFNQSEILARQIGRCLDMPVLTGRLKRTKNTKDQVGLDMESRHNNVVDAFTWIGRPLSGNVLLVDDVFTTGATLNACAGVLRQAGADAVEAVVFAVRQRPARLPSPSLQTQP
jgi:ComF family protein